MLSFKPGKNLVISIPTSQQGRVEVALPEDTAALSRMLPQAVTLLQEKQLLSVTAFPEDNSKLCVLYRLIKSEGKDMIIREVPELNPLAKINLEEYDSMATNLFGFINGWLRLQHNK